MFNYSGGMGARAENGLSATCYPTGVSAVPIEVRGLDSHRILKKELIDGSGGQGKFCGGDGQRIGFKMKPSFLALNAHPVDSTFQHRVVTAVAQVARLLPTGMENSFWKPKTRNAADGRSSWRKPRVVAALVASLTGASCL